MWKWIRKNWRQSVLIATAAYAIHIVVEAFIVTNIFAAFGVKIPVFVTPKFV